MRVNPKFQLISLQQWVFDTFLQKIANVIPTAVAKQSAKAMDILFQIYNNSYKSTWLRKYFVSCKLHYAAQ